jgi:hypothetical protein
MVVEGLVVLPPWKALAVLQPNLAPAMVVETLVALSPWEALAVLQPNPGWGVLQLRRQVLAVVLRNATHLGELTPHSPDLAVVLLPPVNLGLLVETAHELMSWH